MRFRNLFVCSTRRSLESYRPDLAASRAMLMTRVLLVLACGLASTTMADAAAPPDSIRDNFNRPDGAVGGSWVGDLANARLSGGQLVVPGPSSLSYAYYNQLLQPTQYVHVTIKTPVGTSVTGQSVTLRGQSNNSRVQVTVLSSGRVGVKTATDGVWSGYLATATASFVAGDKIAARIDSDGTLDVFKNGTSILTTSLSTWKYARSSGYVGISGYTGMTIDDFGFGAWGGVATVPTNRSPVAAASGTLSVSFSGAGSSDPDNDPLTYSWAFGDGSTGTGQLVTHAYATAGSYNVRLTVSDGRGGSSSSTVTVALTNPVPPPPPSSPLSVSFSFHVPRTNDSTQNCGTHRPGPTQSDDVMAHWRVSPLGIEDSTLAARGALVTKTYAVPTSGGQTIVAWVSRWGLASGEHVYLRSCDSTPVPVTAYWVAQIRDLNVRDSGRDAPANPAVNAMEQPTTEDGRPDVSP